MVPAGLGSLLPGRTERTERTAPSCKYICVCIERTRSKNRTQNLALPSSSPPPHPFPKTTKKKVYKNILQEFFKVYSSLPACPCRPAPAPQQLCPQGTSAPTHPARHTDRQTDGRETLLLPLPWTEK